MVSDKKILTCLHYVSQYKTCEPKDWAILAAAPHRVPLGDATYQIIKILAGNKCFMLSLYKSLFEMCDPGVGHF